MDVETRYLKSRYFVPIAAEHKTSPLADDKDLARNLWCWSDHKVTESFGKGWQEAAEAAFTA